MSYGEDASPHQVLNVSRNASAKELKMAYLREAKKHHPDLNQNSVQSKRRFQQINRAYELLSEPKEQIDHMASDRYKRHTTTRNYGRYDDDMYASPFRRNHYVHRVAKFHEYWILGGFAVSIALMVSMVWNMESSTARLKVLNRERSAEVEYQASLMRNRKGKAKTYYRPR